MENAESIEFWAEDKRLAMREANRESDPQLKKAMLGYVNFCDCEIGRILKRKRTNKLLWGLACLIVFMAGFIQGCQTLKGATGDAAWTFQKLSDNIQTQEKK